jgi:16S rRNA (adenine1518-N6/adenine1519-N6)-dimethyltransferase
MMVDKDVIRKIADAADIRKGETVLEIGAGSGNLTRELAAKTKNVVAVEIDRGFEKELGKIKGIKVIVGNGLEEIIRIEFDKLVANLPYAICEPLVWKLVGIDFRLAVLTVPRGFANLLCAGEDDKKRSKISIAAQSIFNVEVIGEVPREAFNPAPKTDSVIVRMIPKPGKGLQREVLKRRSLLVKNAIMRALFSARKMTKNHARKAIKTLKLNNKLLEKRLLETETEELDAVLESIGKL